LARRVTRKSRTMFASLLLSAGSLSDRVGARRAFGAGLALFVLASAACGLAQTLPVSLQLPQPAPVLYDGPVGHLLILLCHST
jgi:MFS family permease